jgi:4-hydroxy-2-oxoglutarate aldolase
MHELASRLRGVLPPLVTPFREDGGVDLAAFERNLEAYAEAPLAGYLVLGSNGEACALDENEKLQLVRVARAGARGRPVLAGTGLESTRGTIELTRRAAEAGADAALVVTPHYFKSQLGGDALVRHYEAVATAAPIPVLLYSVPGYTGLPLPAAAAIRLAAHPNAIGIKESSGDMGFLSRVLGAAPDLSFLCGSAGATGGILAVACAEPRLTAALFEATRAGDHERARTLQRALVPLAAAVTTVHGVPGLKAAMDLAGLAGGWPRAPLAPVSPAVREEIRETLARARSAAA